MRVQVDESGAHDETGGGEGVARRLGQGAGGDDRHDAAISHTEITLVAGSPRAVDDGCAQDPVVEHAAVPLRCDGYGPSTVSRRRRARSEDASQATLAA